MTTHRVTEIRCNGAGCDEARTWEGNATHVRRVAHDNEGWLTGRDGGRDFCSLTCRNNPEERRPMTDTAALYRTLVRLAGMDDTTVTLVIPATDFDQLVFAKDDVHIPRWLLDKEIGYRFFAKVPILAERPEQVWLADCEHDPRTPAEQTAHVKEVLDIATASADQQDSR